MNVVKIVDFYSIASFHEVINTSMAIMCSRIFDKTIYVAGQTSCHCIEDCYKAHEKTEHQKICFKAKYVCEKDSSLGAFIRMICGFFFTIKEYLFTRRKSVILYNYANPLSMPIILMLNYILHRKVIFLMHGELEFQLKKNLSFMKPIFWYRLCHKLSFKYLLKHNVASILVLGDSIKDNLCQLYPSIAENIISICHPYFLNSQDRYISQHVLTVGTIGVMKKGKGIDSLIELSENLCDEIEGGNLIIKSIGKIEDIDPSMYKNIQWVGGKNLMPREFFESQIMNLDFVIFLYPPTAYKLTASGAIMDAVSMGKPIISLHNDYFDYLMKDASIGYLVDNITEMTNIIRYILRKKEKADFNQGFENLREMVSISYNTSLLRLAFKEHSYI